MHLLPCFLSALNVTSDICGLQSARKGTQDGPIPTSKREDLLEEEGKPNERENTKGHPKELALHRVDNGFLFQALKDPHIRTIVFDVIPPSQTNQQTATNILGHPKV